MEKYFTKPRKILAFIILFIVTLLLICGLSSCTKTTEVVNPPMIPCNTVTRNMTYSTQTRDTVYPGDHIITFDCGTKHYISKASQNQWIDTSNVLAPYWRYSIQLGVTNHSLNWCWGTNTTNGVVYKFTEMKDSIVVNPLIYVIYISDQISDVSGNKYVWIKNYYQL